MTARTKLRQKGLIVLNLIHGVSIFETSGVT